MAAVSVPTADSDFRPPKIPKLDENAVVKPKRTTTYDRLRLWETEKDEYVRQYLQFYCQYRQTKGFGIEWEKFDYFFDWCDPWDGAPRLDMNQTNEELIKDVTNRAIDKYNDDNKGMKLVLVEHVSANYRSVSYVEFWVTFWARDMSSPCPESKLYQAKIIWHRGFQFPIFRTKPTDQEMKAATLRIRTPLPINYDIDKPPIVFRRAGPGEDPVPGTPFVFSRDGWEYESDSSGSDSEDERDWKY